MNIDSDKLTTFKSPHRKVYVLYECKPCKFETYKNAFFCGHKATLRCVQRHGDWFLKCKKKGYKNYHHIVHAFYWNQVMKSITTSLK